MNKKEKRALKILAEAKRLYFDRDANGIIETEDHRTLKPCLIPDFYNGLSEGLAKYKAEIIYANGYVNFCCCETEYVYRVSDEMLAKAVLHRLEYRTAKGFKHNPNED